MVGEGREGGRGEYLHYRVKKIRGDYLRSAVI